MTGFDLDWWGVLQKAAVWEGLSQAARQAFLNGGGHISTTKVDGPRKLLVDAGMARVNAKWSTFEIVPAWDAFAECVRALVEDDILREYERDDLAYYLQGHFSDSELYALDPEHRHYYDAESRVACAASSLKWVEDFLDEKSFQAKRPTSRRREMPSWLKQSKSVAVESSDLTKVTATAHRVVRELMARAQPVRMTDLPEMFADLPGQELGKAIRLGIERVVLFPSIDDKLVLHLGLWKPLYRRLQARTLALPASVEPTTNFFGATLMEDMTTVLVTVAANPVRLRGNDGALFAKAQQELAAQMLPVPDWVNETTSSSPNRRLAIAQQWLSAQKFARPVGKRGENLRLEATQEGRKWLSLSAKDRLKSLLDQMRLAEKSAKPKRSGRRVAIDDSWDDYDGDHGPSAVADLLSLRLSGTSRGQEDQFRAAVGAAFASVPRGEFVPIQEFLAWHSLKANPLVEAYGSSQKQGLSLGWSYERATDEELEDFWENALRESLVQRLFPLGCAKLGLSGSGTPCFTLTDAGLYVLGQVPDFDYGPQLDGQSPLIVQPNFDVVFLAPSPMAEATVARFAERRGRGLGSLFAITKKSIVAAAGTGMKGEHVLDTLQKLSSKPLPQNVAREIAGWFDQCRRIDLRNAIVISCPDRDTAVRVVATAGKGASLLTDTLVELTAPKAKTELLRKLRALGIFADGTEASS